MSLQALTLCFIGSPVTATSLWDWLPQQPRRGGKNSLFLLVRNCEPSGRTPPLGEGAAGKPVPGWLKSEFPDSGF